MSNALVNYSIAINADTTKFIRGMGLARDEAAKVARTLRDSEPAAQKLSREIALLDKAFGDSAGKSRQYAQALDHLKQKYGDATKLGSTFASEMQSAFRFLTPQVLAASAAVGTFYGAFRVGQDAIQKAADIESAGIQFEVMTGSVKMSKQLISEMRTLAGQTTLSFAGVSKAAQTMLAFGVDVERVMPIMRQLGDVARGDDERLRLLTLAFSQVSSAGKLMGQDLLQLVNAGFNPLQIISERTGMSMGELRKRMEEGQISTRLVELAFADATAEGGRFNGMLERQKETFAGQQAELKANIDLMKTKLGEEFLPLVKQVTKELAKMFEAGTGKDGQQIDSWAKWTAKRLEEGFAGSMDTLDFFTNQDFAFESPRFKHMQELLKKRMADIAKATAPEQGDNPLPERAPNQELLDEIAKLKADLEEEKKKEEKQKNDLLGVQQREYEQALKRLEIEKYGKAIAEENEAIRKGIGQEDARRIGDLVRQTEELDRQQKAAEKYKRTIESEIEKEQTKIENARDKMDKIGAVDSLNPETRRAGSVEAYKFNLQKQNDQVKRMEQQKKIAEAQLAVQRKTLSAVERLRPMVVVN